MAEQVRVQINGVWTVLTKNGTTGLWEGTLSAPNITSYNVNSNHYYPVTAEATDKAGNVTTKNDTDGTLGNSLKLYVKEVTKPTIAFTAPASSAHLSSNTPSISFQLRDEASGSAVKITTLAIKVDGGATITNTSPGVTVNAATNGYDVTYVPQVALSDGAHTVTVNVQDNDGNIATQASRSFSVDTVPPTLNVTTPAESTTYQNVTALTVVGTTNDAISSPVTIAIKLNTVDQGAVTVDGSGNFSKAITLAAGSNTVEIKATDGAGKTSTITRTVVYSNSVPVITSLTITPNPVNTGASYTISADITMSV